LLPAESFIAGLDRVARSRDHGAIIVCDNGLHFRSRLPDPWADHYGITLAFIEPGSLAKLVYSSRASALVFGTRAQMGIGYSANSTQLCVATRIPHGQFEPTTGRKNTRQIVPQEELCAAHN